MGVTKVYKTYGTTNKYQNAGIKFSWNWFYVKYLKYKKENLQKFFREIDFTELQAQ